MSKINLIYLSPWNVGGSTSFTAHLAHSLMLNSIAVDILRVGKRTEHFIRPLGSFNLHYRNVSLEDMLKEIKKTPSLLTAPAPMKSLCDPDSIEKMIKAGMRVVVHDPNEFTMYQHLPYVDNPIIIRKNNSRFFEKSVFIPHPYLRTFPNGTGLAKTKKAVCTTLITNMKNIETILEANRMVSKKNKVVFVGKENRFYTHHKIKPKFPEFEGSAGFARSLHASPDISKDYEFSIDLTVFKEDGGDSSYSILEAMDAEAVPVLHTGWTRFKGRLRHGVNCMSIESADQLADILNNKHDRTSYVKEGTKFLSRHRPDKIARLYFNELCK